MINIPNSKGFQKGKQSRQISAVDLFCGVGGLTHGLIQGGIEVAAGIDIDIHCHFPYEINNKSKFFNKDIREIGVGEIKSLFQKNSIRLLAGCAPCQPFSTYSQKSRSSRKDNKWDLLLDFGRLICDSQPELVTMENVPQLLDHPVFGKFLDSLAGYHIWYDVIDCVKYGVPQTRRRLVLLASRLGPISLIPPTHTLENPRTVYDVISKLPPLRAGEAHQTDPLHRASSLSQLNLKRIRASKPGGTWRDWPAKLRAKCHTKDTGQTYPSVYGRMEWETPAPTITTQCFGFGNGRFGHPEQDRAISLREAAIIQTFPENYQFVPDNSAVKFNVLGRLIGNAVPVLIGKVVAQSFQNHIANFPSIQSSNSKSIL
ncbi:MAG: DNA cytosine methyltransferase [Trueperaceae bacterium]